MGQTAEKQFSAKEYFLHQSIQKRKLEHDYRAPGNEEAIKSLLMSMLHEQWLKIFFSVKYDLRTWSVKGNPLQTDDGKPVKEHLGEVSRWDSFGYDIQQRQDEDRPEIAITVKLLLLDAMKNLKDRRWKMLLSLYLSPEELPFDTLTSEAKLDEHLAGILYREFLDEVRHAAPILKC